MRATAWCMVMGVLLMASGQLQADLTATSICTATGDQVQPAIDGDWIIWHDARNGTADRDIYGYILSEPNEVPICTVSGSDQRYAKVSGDITVWEDARNSQRDIRAFDLQNRVPLDLPGLLLNDGVIQRYPKISGNYVLYEDFISNVAKLRVYNILNGTVTPFAASDYSQINSVIDGMIAVWMEKRGSVDQLYYCDVSQPGSSSPVSSSSYGQWYPAVSGDIIVWAEDRGMGTGFDIYRYDLSEGREYSVYTGNGTQTRPAICGNLIVWQDESKGSSNFDIWGVDITAGNPIAIATGTQHDQNPAISGRRVVWQRSASTVDIYMAVIPTPTAIAVDSPAAGQQFLAETEIEISWHLVDGTAPAAVKVEFTPDGGAWQTLAASVPFDATYLWQPIADVDSTQCKIRVSDTSDSLVSALSGEFTIFQCDDELTADLTGDCFVGLDDFAAMASQWLGCGNPYDGNWCFE